MLLLTMHLPRLYSDLPVNEAGARQHCSQMLALLRDVERNCVLLVDEGNIMTGEMFAGAHKWPQKYRKKGQELLRELGNRRRMVKVGNDATMEVACSAPGCQHAVGILNVETPDVLVGPEGCQQCASFAESGVAVTGISDYQLSSFADLRRETETIALTDGEWGRVEFEQRVWQPLFRYAKDVKIFDRYIGRHLQRERGGGFYPQLKPEYSRSLEWIFGQFAALSEGRATRVFEITCGLEEDRLSPEDMVGAAEVLRSFARMLSEKYGLHMAMNVKVERHDAKMPHARCIITDQLALSVERGFDLLRRDGRIRDVVVGLLPNRGEIERQARTLPDVPSA